MAKKHLFLSFFLTAMLCIVGVGSAWGAIEWSVEPSSGSNRTLYISGSGAMNDYTTGTAPWYTQRSYIKTIVIYEGVTRVGNYAFEGTAATSITIPVSVKSFGENAFKSHTVSSRNVYYAGTPNEWADIDFEMETGKTYPVSHPFYNTTSTSNHIYLYGENTETVKIIFTPGIETIKPYAFYYAGNITNVNIPQSVTSVGKQAFSHCSNLCRYFVFNTTAPDAPENAFESTKTGTNTSWLYLPVNAKSTGDGGFQKRPWYYSSGGNGAARIGYNNTDNSASATGNNFSVSNSKVYPTSGTVNGISWSLDEKGVMTFNGSGAISTSFVTSTNSASIYPWLRFSDFADTVVIKGGVTALSNALQNFSALRAIKIEQDVIPTGSSNLPEYYVHGKKVNVYLDASFEGNANLSSAPWNNSSKMNLVFSSDTSEPECNAPTDLTRTALSATSATFRWTAGGSETQWQYMCIPAGDTPDWSDGTLVHSTSSRINCVVSGLTPGNDYEFFVRADCGGENGQSAAISAEFTPDCFTPTGLTRTAVTTTSATFQWTAGGSDSQWQYMCIPAGDTPDWSDGTLVHSTSYHSNIMVSSLNPGSSYVFYVRTNCGVDGGKSDVIYTEFTTLCKKPSDLLVSNIATTSATASWTDNSGDTWKYLCLLADEDEPTSSEWESAPYVNTTSVNLTSLTPATQYTLYIMSDCGVAGTSDAITKTFATGCAAIESANLPFNEGFESATANQLPICWNQSDNASGTVRASSNNAHSGTQSLRLYGGTPADNITAILPEFEDDIKDLALSFWYKNANADYIDPDWGVIQYGRIQPGYIKENVFHPIGDPLAQTTSYVHFEDFVIAEAPAGAYFAIQFCGGVSTSYAYIDDITVTTKPASVCPTQLTFSSISDEEVTCSWNANGMSSWRVQTSTDGENWGEAIVASTNSYTFTGLDANTTYYVRVKGYNNGESSTSICKAFTTFCESISTLPWTYGFEDDDINTIPDCWRKHGYYSSTTGFKGDMPLVSNRTGEAHDGSKFLLSHGGGSSSTTMAILPPFAANTGNLTISFWYNNLYTTSTYGQTEIGYITDPTDASTYTALTQLDRVNEYTYVDKFQMTGAPDNAFIAIRHAGGSSDYGYSYIDDITVAVPTEVFEDVATNNQTRLEALMGQTLNITINRPLLRNGDYCTLTLPFDLSAEQIADEACPLHGFTIKEFESSESGDAVNIYLNEVSEIEAGKPYFVRYAGAPTNERLTPLTFRNVTVAAYEPASIALTDDCTPHGVFNPYALIANDQTTLFLSSNNTLYYPSANGTMNGFRAYLKVGGALSAPIRRGAPIRIVEKENTATGIENGAFMNGDASLNGAIRKILHDGQMIIIRDGKEYNAQGQLMK